FDALERRIGDGREARRRLRRLVGVVDAKVARLDDAPVVLRAVEEAVGRCLRTPHADEEKKQHGEQAPERARPASKPEPPCHDPEYHHAMPKPRRGMAIGKKGSRCQDSSSDSAYESSTPSFRERRAPKRTSRPSSCSNRSRWNAYSLP